MFISHFDSSDNIINLFTLETFCSPDPKGHELLPSLDVCCPSVNFNTFDIFSKPTWPILTELRKKSPWLVLFKNCV